jgi:class 3 adenylate cyclase
MTVRWDSFFQPSLPPNANGFIAVVSNPCNQTFTFELTGNEVIYLGPEDLHDIAYNKYADSSLMTSSGSSFTDIGLSETYCPYKIEVFPSTQMQDAFVTNRPLMFTMGVTSIFVFTGLIFIFYDYLVHRRQRFLAEAAYKSNAIVSALFPQIVRDRLFDDTNRSAQKGLKHFVNQTSAPTLDQREDLMKKAPIADLFTNATVMFGDISGFTAWSSTRQPTEVFVLLETLYGAFDKIARHMEVFKVETIGDCYVAVTGLPVPQEDHHLRMVRFARHTLEKMSVLTRELEVSLGPDTTNLGFRIGLHSGPVTAGVLRGEKSRFQLFGDTVNTASRMESTGRPNAIQISQSTADLLLACGKSYWMRKREELVQAKGKGEIQTYWIKTKVASAEKKEGSESSLESQRQNSDIWQGVEDHKSTRNGIRNTLIEWQVELLSRLLKQIVLHRESKKGKKIHEPLINLDVINTQPRDQIAEKIVMPAFDSHATRKSLKASVELPENVVTQLHDLVTTIALLYHDNHFHNYEHACHVTMSANKLLSRIVVPANLESSAIGSGLGLKQAHDYTYGLTSDPLTQFAVVFSAIVHDIDHHGVSNAQLTKENNRLASVYQEKSIAEQNSIDLAFEILTASTYSELVSCICADEKEYKRFRQLVINCVMATDM